VRYGKNLGACLLDKKIGSWEADYIVDTWDTFKFLISMISFFIFISSEDMRLCGGGATYFEGFNDPWTHTQGIADSVTRQVASSVPSRDGCP